MTREKSRGARRGRYEIRNRWRRTSAPPGAVVRAPFVPPAVEETPGQERSAVLVRVECSVRPWDAVDISMLDFLDTRWWISACCVKRPCF
jgi:hypothetical protein